ncbi:MAG: hypothetical protein IAF38_19490, partial [Bacteroidia bacterium]|nr:hypothetical protein [Bacteroidia bacterium]
FIRIKNPKEEDYISLQGFLIDTKDNIKLKNLYERDILDLQESGLGIDTSYVDAQKNFFIIKGYQPNFMERKFFKIVWLNEDEIVLNIGFNKKDSLLWEKRTTEIIRKGISCQ